MQLGEGVDDATWLYHLQQHHYSSWMAEAIKDEALSSAVRHIEKIRELTASESRRLIRAAIEERYTMPAEVSDRGVS